MLMRSMDATKCLKRFRALVIQLVWLEAHARRLQEVDHQRSFLSPGMLFSFREVSCVSQMYSNALKRYQQLWLQSRLLAITVMTVTISCLIARF